MYIVSDSEMCLPEHVNHAVTRSNLAALVSVHHSTSSTFTITTATATTSCGAVHRRLPQQHRQGAHIPVFPAVGPHRRSWCNGNSSASSVSCPHGTGSLCAADHGMLYCGLRGDATTTTALTTTTADSTGTGTGTTAGSAETQKELVARGIVRAQQEGSRWQRIQSLSVLCTYANTMHS